MPSHWLIAAEMLITLGVCLGFGVHQLWSLRRLKAERLRKEAEAERGALTPP